MREAGFRNRRLFQCRIVDPCAHRQRSDPMGGIAACGHPTGSLVDQNRGLLERDPGLHQRQDPGNRWSRIEGAFPPPVQVAHADVGNIKAPPIAKALGNSQCHPDRATVPVPGCQSQQDTDDSVLAIVHPAKPRAPNDSRASGIAKSPSALSKFKFTPMQSWLTADGLEHANTDLVMVWHRNRYCALWQSLLHGDVATASAHFYKAMSGQNGAHLLTRKDSEITQAPPQPGLRKSRHEDVV